jgi:hypothetical protein
MALRAAEIKHLSPFRKGTEINGAHAGIAAIFRGKPFNRNQVIFFKLYETIKIRVCQKIKPREQKREEASQP